MGGTPQTQKTTKLINIVNVSPVLGTFSKSG